VSSPLLFGIYNILAKSRYSIKLNIQRGMNFSSLFGLSRENLALYIICSIAFGAALGISFFIQPNESPNTFLALFFLYSIIFFWPIFRFVGPVAIIREQQLRGRETKDQPWWKDLDSPWWAVPAMWAVTLRIWPPLSALDLSAFALPL